MIERAASRNNAHQESNLLTNLFESSKKLINEISTTVTFDGSDSHKETVSVNMKNHCIEEAC